MTAALTTAQNRFQNYLLDPEQTLDDLIAEGGRASRATRLDIYSNAYRVRMVEAASADYAQLKNYMGEAAFEALIYAYLRENPSRQPTLRWFGEKLGEFLEITQPYASHPGLYEMAAFEWALCGAFDAAEAEPLQMADLAALTPQQWVLLRPLFHPSLRCVALQGNLPQIWEALNEERDPPALQFGEPPITWLVWRKQQRLLFRPLTTEEQLCLKAFMEGANIGDVCVPLADEMAAEQIPAHIAGLLARWVDDALLVRPPPAVAGSPGGIA